MRNVFLFTMFILILIQFFGNAAAEICTDSDGGMNLYVKGRTTGIDEYENCLTTKEDECSFLIFHGTPMTIVREYFCNRDHVLAVESPINRCPYGCSDGACISPTGIPDLIIENITLEFNNANGRDKYVYKVYIKNIGTGPMSYDKLATVLNVHIDPLQIYINCWSGGCGEGYLYEYELSEGYITLSEDTINRYGISEYGHGLGFEDKDILYPGGTKIFSGYFNPIQSGYVNISASIWKYDVESSPELNVSNNDLTKTFYVEKTHTIKDCADIDESYTYYEGQPVYYIKGYVFSPKGVTIDTCESDDKTLLEGICVNGQMAQKSYQCPNLCKDGACAGICGDGVCEPDEDYTCKLGYQQSVCDYICSEDCSEYKVEVTNVYENLSWCPDALKDTPQTNINEIPLTTYAIYVIVLFVIGAGCVLTYRRISKKNKSAGLSLSLRNSSA